MDVRAPLERGSQPERAGEMRRGMEPVERDTWTDRVAARDGAERGDARARRRVDPAWRRRDRAHHVGETRELRAIVRDVRLVRGGEMREQTVDLEVTELADRGEPRRRLRERCAKARESRVHLEMHARDAP